MYFKGLHITSYRQRLVQPFLLNTCFFKVENVEVNYLKSTTGGNDGYG